MKALLALKRKLSKNSLKRFWLNFALKGNQVECPCCKKKFETFISAGLQKRANARCVGCNSLERHRLMWLFLERETQFFSSKLKVLNVAPEKLFYNKFRALPNIDYVSIDLNPDMYDYGSKTIRMDLTDLKFDNNTFDVIICNHVLEHVPNDSAAISEMYRALKPGGWAMINVPVDHNREVTFEDIHINDPKNQLELFGQHDHVRVYGKDYVNRLRGPGFEVEVFDYTNRFTNNEIFRYGLQKGEEIYLCRKK